MKRFSYLFLLIASMIIVMPKLADANKMNFSVKAILPENQRDQTHTYFDLNIVPGTTQVIEVELKNETDNDVTVQTVANTAVTNDNGIVEYTNEKPKLDKSLATPFSKIASVQSDITIPKQSSLHLPITLKIPEKSFDGVILGGLYFKEKETDQETKKSKDDVQIENKFSYTIGVLLAESPETVLPDLVLNDVKATQKVGRNVVTANLQNPKAALLSNLTVDAKVYEAESNQLLHEEKQTSLRMAPNSNFNYSVSWGNEAFKTGDYRIEITATDGNQNWHLKKGFKIKGEEAKKYNDSAVHIAQKSTPWTYWLMGGIIIVLLIVIAILILKNKKKKSN